MFKENLLRSLSLNMAKSPKDKPARWRRSLCSELYLCLMRRTSFTILLVSVIFCQSVCAEVVTETTKLSPIYIPLTEGTTEKVTEKVTEKTTEKVTEKPRYLNQTIKSGNTLFDGLVNECLKNPSMSCIQKNVYSYLDDTLGFSGDVNVTDGFKFYRNKLPYWKYTEMANRSENDVDSEEGSYEDEDESARYSESPIEEVTDALYGKGVSFMMSHDMELQLPEMMFNGARLKVSPRGMEGDGALVRLDLIPKEVVARNENGEGRILFKKIKKWIKSKILLAIIAIVLIVKLIKLKLFVFLPLIMGVHNAKKLFLKLVLFVFPALSHIFKLCSWYHSNYHGTKHHHHHHQISHLHHTVPHVPPAVYGRPPFGGGGPVEIHETLPPGALPPPGTFAHRPIYSHEPDSWVASGPGLGPEYISHDVHRNAVASPGASQPGSFVPKLEDGQEISSWGLGGSPSASTGVQYVKPSPYADENQYMKQALEAVRLKNPQGPPITTYANQFNQVKRQLTPAEREAMMRFAQRQQQQYRIQQLKNAHKTTVLSSIPAANPNSISDNPPVSPVFDPFYSPVLQRVDQIFQTLNFNDEGCRERLVCSMYKNPTKFSPHSNILSNEISREASELPKPTTGSTVALRFFRYVQAAREGQEKKECLTLYPNCSIDTDKTK